MKKYTLIIKVDEDGTTNINGSGDGFTDIEILGHLEMTKQYVIKKINQETQETP